MDGQDKGQDGGYRPDTMALTEEIEHSPQGTAAKDTASPGSGEGAADRQAGTSEPEQAVTGRPDGLQGQGQAEDGLSDGLEPGADGQQLAPWQQQGTVHEEQPGPADNGRQNTPTPGQQGTSNSGWQNAPAPGQQGAPGNGWQSTPAPGQQGTPDNGWQSAPAPGQQGPWQPWNGNRPQQGPYPQGGYQPPYQQGMPQRDLYGQGRPQGPQQELYGPNGPQQKPPTNNLAVTSMIMGIASILLCCCCFPVGFIISFALGMGGLALAIISKKGQPFSAFAIAGLVLSILGICGSLFIFGCYMLTAQMMKDPEYSALFNEIFQQYYNGD